MERINSLQTWYGVAVKSNKGNPEAMERATWASLYHNADPPDHKFCPTGATSWCRFQSDKVTGLKTYKPVRKGLVRAVIEVMLPVYKRLVDRKLLEATGGCRTQNPNESLHHVIWSLVLKEQYNSPEEIKLAIDLGILYFNRGRLFANVKVMQALGISVTHLARKCFLILDEERVAMAERKCTAEEKKKRKKRRSHKLKQLTAFQTVEGVQYGSDKFTTRSDSTDNAPSEAPAPAAAAGPSGEKKTPTTRRPQMCRKCGQPRKGHKCTAT